MALDSLVRSCVALAKGAVLPLMVTVQHEVFTGRGTNSVPTFAAPVPRKAIVNEKVREFHTPAGQTIMATGPITFLENVVMTTEDRLTLPDGRVAPVIALGGLADPLVPTGSGYVSNVWIGK